ncbi:alkaline phosphatase D family protein [Pseudoalteromonas piscicida]|uniref:alkaline phosphatase D family protein n=1 Tax=Pseudoalteromonas piscicida TaxID=43662 RepID=UPI003C7C6523
MSLLNPKVGPVIGVTTEQTVRVMCGIQSAGKDAKPNCGWIRIKPADGDWELPKQFRFNQNFFYTGVIELTGLRPNTTYCYQVGYNPTFSEQRIESESNWADLPEYSFSTLGREGFRFCFGSCLRNNGDERFGKALRVVKAFNEEKPLDMMLWLGDQVYNDMYLGLTINNSSTKDFKRLYRKFFDNQYVKDILCAMPNYMVMDDHEVEDSFKHGAIDYQDTKVNWLTKDKDRLINSINAFYSYQASHGPIFDVIPSDVPGVSYVKGQEHNQVPVRHYAAVDFGSIGLFLMDSRKERSSQGLISRAQENALLDFLNSHYKVKLIGTSVTFLADNYSNADAADNWKKAAEQRKRILDHMTKKNITNVFFLSGDVHSHFACRLNYEGKPTSIHQLVSGSLFWPTSFIINSIRWFKDDVRFSKAIYGASRYSISEPLSTTKYDLYASNGVAYVEVKESELIFEIRDTKGNVIISNVFPLE